MTRILATQTLLEIHNAIKKDQGALFRQYEKQTLPAMDDAYSGDTFPFRSHMGASIIGKECSREIWYSFRWAKKPEFDAQLLRLFNRGHLEEARFIAMLLNIGVLVYQSDENGKQYRISAAGGHFGGSGDGVAIGISDVQGDIPVLLEFKTSAEKAFKLLKANGVEHVKHEHFVQMQVYMYKMGLPAALYMVVNKNNDELYGEIIEFNQAVGAEYINRGEQLVFYKTPPTKVRESESWLPCKWCDYKAICHRDDVPAQNCRTCKFSEPLTDGSWVCTNDGVVLDKGAQYDGCHQYQRLF